ncbi:MAG: SLBB domain-containing protein [Bacteroidetes bacterium]|nr:SLBB domain-containing protein [Bacteroidota bacterium]
MKNRLYLIFFQIIIISSIQFAQTLLPGDGIRILFYNISDPISGDYFVQKDESLMLPYLGKINILNMGFDSVKKEIITKYSSLYRNPEISILPLLKVNILGEVRTPGFYYVTGIEKLPDLIAKAGGTTPDADLEDIYITRNNQKIEIDGQKIIESNSKINDIGLQSGDGIYITRRWFTGSTSTIIISAIAAVTSIIAAIIYTQR